VKPGELLTYVKNFDSPRSILEAITYRQWTQYMASVDPMQVMTTERAKASESLRESIQQEADQRGLGIKILNVGLVGMHPPVDVAKSYEAAIDAHQEKETVVWKAKGDRNERLPAAEAAKVEIVAKADADRYAKVTLEQAQAERFKAQLKGYQAGPNVFFLRQYLDVFASSSESARKFVQVVEDPNRMMLIIEDKEKVPAGLLGLGEQITEQVKKEEQEGR